MRRPWLVSWLFMAVVAVAAIARAAPEPPRVLGIEIEARYVADKRFRDGAVERGPFAIARLRLPLARHAARRLARVGVRIDAGAAESGARLVIRVEGVARGQLYDYMERLARKRGLRYAAADLRGEIAVLDPAGGRVCRARFSGGAGSTASISVVARRDLRESPLFAPFDAALGAPGSFLDALDALVARVYGGPARAALATPVACANTSP